jgi:Spy/CpxP family protein refolding chaperone
MNADTMLQRLTTQLTLTSDQQTQIKPLIDTYISTVQGIMADSSLAPADQRTQRQAARTTFNTAVNAILTSDQQTKFAAMNAKRGRRGGGGGGGGGAGASSPASSP